MDELHRRQKGRNRDLRIQKENVIRPQYLFLILLTIPATWQIREQWRHRELKRQPGILVNEEPQQVLLPPTETAIVHNKEPMQPLATYEIRARLISRQRYFFDHGAGMAPLDFCVGWGPMSDSAVLNRLSFSQDGRWCSYHYSKAPPLDQHQIDEHMANMHLIPDTPSVALILEQARPGNIVSLKGYLVRIDYRDGAAWKSSLSRTDRRNGACELMLVNYASVE